MSSLTGTENLESKFYQMGIVRRIDRWLHAMPHPSLVVEIAPGHVAAARWGSGHGDLEDVVVESLPAGSVMPSPVDNNITQPDAVRAALRRVFNRIPTRGAPIAVLIPDPVVRVFILPFENLPRRADEALPLLRWRLKKSVPFDVEETVVSWMRQTGSRRQPRTRHRHRAPAHRSRVRRNRGVRRGVDRRAVEFNAGRFAASRGARRNLAGAPLRARALRARSFTARICASIGRRICLPMHRSSIRRWCSTRFSQRSPIIRTLGMVPSIASAFPDSAHENSFSGPLSPRN